MRFKYNRGDNKRDSFPEWGGDIGTYWQLFVTGRKDSKMQLRDMQSGHGTPWFKHCYKNGKPKKVRRK